MPCQSTVDFLTAAKASADETHDGVRRWIREGLPLLASLAGEAKTLQADLYCATEDETDDALASKFRESNDNLKTIDRLATEIATAARSLSSHLRDTEAHTGDLATIAIASVAASATVK